MRLIDADAFAERVLPQCKYPELLMEQIDQEPTAVPVTYAHWEKLTGMRPPEYAGRHKCSNCSNFAPSNLYGRETLTSWCCCCGANMSMES